jgi:Predicted metal-binding protein
MMKGFLMTIGIAAAIVPVRAAAPASHVAAVPVLMTVYKDPDCGCCKAWVEYIRRHGYSVGTKDTRDLEQANASGGLPATIAGCHTALVGGYVISGHVPAEDIARLLKQKPKIAGLAVKGMPAGSPGMEGSPPVHYQVIAFQRSGKTSVFANH